MTLIERGGRARSVHVGSLTGNTAQRVLLANVDRKSVLMTDEFDIYSRVGSVLLATAPSATRTNNTSMALPM